jgi:hypothetical protein
MEQSIYEQNIIVCLSSSSKIPSIYRIVTVTIVTICDSVLWRL